MAKLYFKYGAMGSSKTATALITKYNYEERGMKVWLIKPSADSRDGQDLRPTEFAQNDFFIWLVRMVYAADTNTNVLPSMHVIGCAALTLACFDALRLRAKKLHLVMLTLGVLISASTVFVKQHSMLDVLVAIPVSVVLCLIVYRPFPRNRLKQNA